MADDRPEDDLKKRSAVRNLMDDLAKEAGWAVNDIRQELVERPWFNRAVTPEFVQEWDRLSDKERENLGPQSPEPTREDLYGRDVEDGREHLREVEPEPEQDIDRGDDFDR